MGADLFPQHRSPAVQVLWICQAGDWIVLSAGLVGAYLKRRDTDDFNFLSLAVFGGLLFLTIFEGGKTRYLIQFLPQILLVASIGLAGFTKKENT